METENLNLGILPEPQRLLWPELKATPAHFVLYGGTAIALKLVHRRSVDFDFFAFKSIEPHQLLSEVPYLQGSTVVQNAPNTLSVIVDRNGSVRVSFFGLPNMGYVKEPESADNGIKIASLIDLAGTKVSTVQQRAEARDYVDIDALITKCDITLPTALAAAKAIYGKQFNPQITLKALSYFEDIGLCELPEDVKHRLIKAVREVDLDRLPIMKAVQKEQ